MDDPQWLTTPEVAELLRVSIRTIHDWRQTGTGPPAYRVGRQLLWKRREVDDWVVCHAAASAANVVG
jgi:excisionase family DNA binding protein